VWEGDGGEVEGGEGRLGWEERVEGGKGRGVGGRKGWGGSSEEWGQVRVQEERGGVVLKSIKRERRGGYMGRRDGEEGVQEKVSKSWEGRRRGLRKGGGKAEGVEGEGEGVIVKTRGGGEMTGGSRCEREENGENRGGGKEEWGDGWGSSGRVGG